MMCVYVSLVSHIANPINQFTELSNSTSSISMSLLTNAISNGLTRFLRLNEKSKEDSLCVFEVLDDPNTHSLMQYLRNIITIHNDDVDYPTLSSDFDQNSFTNNDSSIFMILGYIGIFIMILFLVLSRLQHTKMKIDALPHNNITQALLNQSHSEYLVCLGDSLTHATVSANYITLLETLLSTSDKHRAHLKIVNGGINSELVYNLRQRIHDVLKLKPKVVTLMIGSNDIKALAVPNCGIDSKHRMNLPQIPTLDFFEKNLKEVLQLLYKGLPSTSEIYVCSIPPLGEDVDSSYNAIHITRANQLIQKMIETITTSRIDKASANQKHSKNNPSIRYVPIYEKCSQVLRHHANLKHKKLVSFEKWSLRRTILTSILHYTFGISWNTLGSILYGYYITVEGLHLNDRGAEIVARTMAATMQNLPLEDIQYSFLKNENVG
jgi:lysophospholipase L1-like esterase